MKTIGTFRSTDRHKVCKLRNTGRRKESGDQYVGIWQVELLGNKSLIDRSDPEIAALLIIKDCTKYAWRIEMRKTVPIDCAIDSYQRDRMHVADDPVIFNTQISHILLFL